MPETKIAKLIKANTEYSDGNRKNGKVGNPNWTKGVSGNPRGPMPVGLSLMQFGRKYLLQCPKGESLGRLRKQWDALHIIASDSTNKQCVQANVVMFNYSFGPPVPDVSMKIAALQVFQNMNKDALEYISLQLTQGDETCVIPEDELIDDDAVEVETVEGEENKNGIAE